MTGLSGLRYAHSAHPVLAGSPLRTAAAALLLVGGTAGSAALFITAVVAGGAEDLLFAPEDGGPVQARELAVSLLLVPLLTLPAALLTARLALRSTAGRVCSVTGRFRWGWYARCLAVSIPLTALVSAGGLWLTGTAPGPGPAEPLAVLAIILLCVPVRSFAEEFVFRGVLTQVLGGPWTRPVLAVAVPAVLTSLLFSLVHAPAGLGVLAVHTVGGICYSVLCDRSGGLEASSAAHTAWNTALLISLVFAAPAHGPGGGSVLEAAVTTAAIDAVLVGALLLLARLSRTAATAPAFRRTADTPVTPG